ncbi:hypothetical protein K435DRAFT_842524 [Dendrothele bispora CBS 962.96]|uniref:Uncharacterized protein n=1 Tax=Dendrothele bispora (strain CBS 962.96) TaxID=1314807 RepID=A0A4S8LEX4_DENBC|nr:hypothetical protein K435DRAFT_842524 [Dendrothele bispora CBS 962.96]
MNLGGLVHATLPVYGGGEILGDIMKRRIERRKNLRNASRSLLVCNGLFTIFSTLHEEEEEESIKPGKVQELNTGVREAPRCAARYIIVPGTQLNHMNELKALRPT